MFEPMPQNWNPSAMFHGASDEHSTLTSTISQIRTLHPELFSLPTVNYEHLLNLASYLVKEQGFMVPYELLDGAAKGEKITQLVLCIWGT